MKKNCLREELDLQGKKKILALCPLTSVQAMIGLSMGLTILNLDMCRKEIKYFLLMLSLFTMWSCNKSITGISDMDAYYIANLEKTESIRSDVLDYYKMLVAQNNVRAKPLLLTEHWSVDRIIYISEDGKRMYSHLVIRDFEWKNTHTDSAIELVGAFINGKWHFIQGDYIIFPRDHYKSDASVPLTYDELSYLLNRNLFPKIVKRNNGDYNINDKFFASRLGSLDSSSPERDSLILAKVKRYSTKSVPIEDIEKVRKEQLASQPKKVKKPNLWQRLFGKKKLFDRRAWKKRKRELGDS